MEKCFNITATCVPSKHYMVDISGKIDRIKTDLIDKNYYFTINRARQFGKTTTLSRLAAKLREDYYVIRISFEGADDLFVSAQSMVNGFLWLTANELRKTQFLPELIEKWEAPIAAPLEFMQLSRRITELCSNADKEVILMIDEVDKCANNELFLSFLGILRDKYIRRAENEDVTFKNVILASVYDIKNLKRKLRPQEEHQYNSPWNVAMDFDIDMSFTADGKKAWTWEGLQRAIKLLLSTQCMLFDDLNKNLDRYPELDGLMRGMLLQGISYPYTISDNTTQLGVQFGYLKNYNGSLMIANRIFETYLYDMYFMREKTENSMAKQGALEKNGFIQDGNWSGF